LHSAFSIKYSKALYDVKRKHIWEQCKTNNNNSTEIKQIHK